MNIKFLIILLFLPCTLIIHGVRGQQAAVAQNMFTKSINKFKPAAAGTGMRSDGLQG